MKSITKDLQNVCGVYKLVNLINGKIYIGSSKNLRMRLWEHRACLRHNNHHNPHLQNAWNKYGEDNFDYCVLEVCNEEQQYEREQFYINTFHPQYNIAEEVLLPPYTEESRKKHSETKKRMFAEGILKPTNVTKIYMYGLNGKFIKEYPSEVSASRELGIYIGLIQKNLRGENKRCHNYMFRYDYSPTIPAYKKTKDVSKQYKPIKVYNDSEEYRFKNADECRLFFNVCTVYIRNAIKHNRRFKRKYKIEYITAR